MNKLLNVFFAIDKNYIQHFTVALTSLLENNNAADLNIFVIHDIEDLSIMDTTLHFIKSKYSAGIKFINIDPDVFSKFRTSLHYSRSTYYRLLIADIVPEDIDKGLFLDSDIIVTGSISELAKIQFDKEYLFAVSEANVEENVVRLNELGFPIKSYFNAGVILINIKAWREERLSEKFMKIADKFMEKLDWVDQDVLNMFFVNNWTNLDRTYNSIHLKRKLASTPKIVHYVSPSKPWHYLNRHPYKSLYWKYLKLTPFKKSKIDGLTFENVLRKQVRILKGHYKKYN